jgi:cytochrome c1
MRLSLLAAVLLAGCGSAATTPAENGRLLLQQFGCGQCHRIPGVANAQGLAGPPLSRVGERAYLGGVLPNTRENMAQWIRDPRRFDPRTTMPAMGMTEAQARDMVAYLMEAK